MALPILKVKDELLRRIEQEQCLIITGDTGSGKSTQIPQFLYNSGYRRIAITQPRRVAAVSLATRVSTEMAVKLGQKVGYTVRFDDCSSDNTELKYLTDGCLLRECIADRNFSRYDVIILDEAHERSLQTDILFGLLFETLRRRPISHGKKGLRVIVTSATLDTKKFCEYFNCRSFHIPGRCFPVEIRNSDEAPRRYVAAAVDTVLAIHRKSAADGHVLVFLTGREEIEDACEMLGRKVDALIDENVDLPDIVILPAYSTLRASEQQKIFYEAPKNCRKVVIATNIAETSLTVPGIKFVVDCGFAKQKVFNEQTGIDSLIVVPESKVAAVQRAGRAGRTCAGICYRLFSMENFERLPNEAKPEIQRSSLPGVLLLLKTVGVSDPLKFRFIDPPKPAVAMDGLRHLFFLGALNDCGEVTSLGKAMARFPLEPSLSKLLLGSAQFACSETMLSIAAMLSADRIWVHYSDKEQIRKRNLSRAQFDSKEGDHFVMEKVFKAWAENSFDRRWAESHHLNFWSLVHAKNVREQLKNIITKMDKNLTKKISKEFANVFITEKDTKRKKCQKILANVFFMNSCRLLPDESKGIIYRPIENFRDPFNSSKQQNKSQIYWMHKSCCLYDNPPDWMIYDRVMYTSKPYAQFVTKIDFEWIVNLLPKLKTVEVGKLSTSNFKILERKKIEKRRERRLDKREIDSDKIESARKRFLQRKK